MASSTNYDYTQVMVKLFKDIDDVGQVTDFWDVSLIIRRFKYSTTKKIFGMLSVYGGWTFGWALLGVQIQRRWE